MRIASGHVYLVVLAVILVGTLGIIAVYLAGHSTILTTVMPTTQSHLAPVVISGRLIIAGNALPGAVIQMQESVPSCQNATSCYNATGGLGLCTGNCWFNLGHSGTTDANGNYSINAGVFQFAGGFVFPTTFSFRGYFAGSTGFPAVVGQTATVIFT